jgi:polyhydroxybutyrate depolymerase
MSSYRPSRRVMEGRRPADPHVRGRLLIDGDMLGHIIALRHDGHERPYLLHAPPIVRGARTPLVLELHGRGIDPVAFDRWTGFSTLADEAGFALAMPGAAGETWNDGRAGDAVEHGRDDVVYLLAVLDDACERLPIDRRRIYLVGMSNGATMAARFSCEQPMRVAALAQVAGTAAVEVAAACRPQVPVPILNIHGTADRFAPYAGGRARGPRARLFLRTRFEPSIGVDDWARRWVEGNNAHDGPRVETLRPDTTVRRWRGAAPVSDVVFCRIEGGGHTWPGSRAWMPPFLGRVSRTLDATRVIWGFLALHSRDA